MQAGIFKRWTESSYGKADVTSNVHCLNLYAVSLPANIKENPRVASVCTLGNRRSGEEAITLFQFNDGNAPTPAYNDLQSASANTHLITAVFLEPKGYAALALRHYQWAVDAEPAVMDYTLLLNNAKRRNQ